MHASLSKGNIKNSRVFNMEIVIRQVTSTDFDNVSV